MQTIVGVRAVDRFGWNLHAVEPQFTRRDGRQPASVRTAFVLIWASGRHVYAYHGIDTDAIAHAALDLAT